MYHLRFWGRIVSNMYIIEVVGNLLKCAHYSWSCVPGEFFVKPQKQPKWKHTTHHQSISKTWPWNFSANHAKSLGTTLRRWVHFGTSQQSIFWPYRNHFEREPKHFVAGVLCWEFLGFYLEDIENWITLPDPNCFCRYLAATTGSANRKIGSSLRPPTPSRSIGTSGNCCWLAVYACLGVIQN